MRMGDLTGNFAINVDTNITSVAEAFDATYSGDNVLTASALAQCTASQEVFVSSANSEGTDVRADSFFTGKFIASG